MDMFHFLESLDNKRSGVCFKIFLAPIWLILEFACFIKYWRKIALVELVENDKIFSFLDKNEFVYKHNKLIAKDVIEPDTIYDSMNIEEAKIKIKAEFVDSLSKQIKENCSIDIENLISLTTDLKVEYVKTMSGYADGKVYTVTIQFCRYWWLTKAIKYTINWLLFVIAVIAILCIFVF